MLSTVDWGNISRGNPVVVAMINLAKAAIRYSENQMGKSASSKSSVGRNSSFYWERDL